MFELIINNLIQSGWLIESLEDNWVCATSIDQHQGLLFGTINVLPKDFNSWTKKYSDIIQWDAIVFCPDGISSLQLKQHRYPNVQLWYWDTQGGNLFPYPPTKNHSISLWLKQLLNGNPVSLEQKTKPQNDYIPVLTYSLVGINIVVFLLMTLAGGSTNQSVLIAFGAKVNSLIREGQVWRLFTSMFIHIGILHLAFNLYALWSIGSLTERWFGRRRFLMIYIISGIGGSLASFIFSPALSAGASGAIFGLLGALLHYSYKRPHLWKSGLGMNLVIIILVNFGFGLSQPGIDNFAHLGGLLTGTTLSFILSIRATSTEI